MADLQKIVNDLSSLTVLEAADLAKMLEEKWGVSAAAAVAVAAGPAAAAAPVEEKTEFTVMLTAVGDKKIEVIKEVRALTSARPEGGQGPRRGRPQGRQGRRHQGRGREGQGRPRKGRRQGGTQVSVMTNSAVPGEILPESLIFLLAAAEIPAVRSLAESNKIGASTPVLMVAMDCGFPESRPGPRRFDRERRDGSADVYRSQAR